jgi:hypothetical protein
MRKFLSRKKKKPGREKKRSHKPLKKGETKLSYAFCLQIKNGDLPESMFLH